MVGDDDTWPLCGQPFIVSDIQTENEEYQRPDKYGKKYISHYIHILKVKEPGEMKKQRGGVSERIHPVQYAAMPGYGS